MEPKNQENEVLKVIANLENNLAEAKRRLVEIRKPKLVAIKNGDIGKLGSDGAMRLFLETPDGILCAFDTSFHITNSGFDRFTEGYTITGNVFK